MTTQSRSSAPSTPSDGPAQDNRGSLAPGEGRPLVITGQGAFVNEYRPWKPTPTITRPDWMIAEPADVYHAKATHFLSSHALADFRRCPQLYHQKELGLIPKRDSSAFAVGRAAHTLILEGRQQYQDEYAVGGPVNPKTGQPYGPTTKAFAEWVEKIGKPVLTESEAAMIEQMAASVRDHIFASELLCEGVAEGVVRTRYGGHDCQARIDWMRPRPGPGIVDLKTCRNLDDFEDDFRKYGYVYQLAFYRMMISLVAGFVPAVHVIAVEKQAPHRCGVWAIDHGLLCRATDINRSAMRELKECSERAAWPTRFESMRLINQL